MIQFCLFLAVLCHLFQSTRCFSLLKHGSASVPGTCASVRHNGGACLRATSRDPVYMNYEFQQSKRLMSRSTSRLMCTSGEEGQQFLVGGDKAPPRAAIFALWAGLAFYTFTYAPGGSEAAKAVDMELIKSMISNPFYGSLNAIFTGVFNALGVLPAVYASLLLPGSKDQKVPALPFVLGSFVGGFFLLGPYLFLRNLNEDVTVETRGRGSGAFESKFSAAGLLAFSCYLYFYVLTQGVGAAIPGYIDLFNAQTLVHISSLDFIVLSLLVVDPMQEDMRRRSYDGPPAAAFALLPIIGPSLYLLLRPSLPDK